MHGFVLEDKNRNKFKKANLPKHFLGFGLRFELITGKGVGSLFESRPCIVKSTVSSHEGGVC